MSEQKNHQEERLDQGPAPDHTEIRPQEGQNDASAQEEKPQGEETAKEEKKPKEKLGFAGNCFGWLQALTGALVILMLVFIFVARVIGVEGSSMLPTLENGDMLLIQCLGYEPEQGDIVVLHKDFAEIKTPIVKRIVAVGGQTVEVDYETSTVYVDGEALDEPYLGEPMWMPDSAYEQGTYWEVPEGSVFVMGDNRNASSDSRHEALGVVDQRYILGKVQLVLYPFHHFGAVE